jgi:hypothetical protein
MNKLPDPNEIARALRRQSRRWTDEAQNPLAMGCPPCIHFGKCGGLFTKQKSMDCLNDCCGAPENCQIVCPRNPQAYLLAMQEVGSFDFDNIPRHGERDVPTLPIYAPLIYHGNSHRKPLELEAAAIFLHELYRRRDGSLRCENRAQIEKRFCLAPGTKIILVGCGPDAPIEGWWGLSGKRHDIIKFFADQGCELATSPNYSLFADIPRFSDLYNMKKVLKAWQEFGAFGQLCALHVNARTQRDYERFIEFIADRPEITNVSFEFGTGAACPSRLPYHRHYLATLARLVSRPLHLTMVGGINAVPVLARAYTNLTYIDTSAFVNAVQRKRLHEGNDWKIGKTDAQTPPGAPIDELLKYNIELMRGRIERLVKNARELPQVRYIAPKPGSPERRLFVRAARPSGQAPAPQSSARNRRSGIADPHSS